MAIAITGGAGYIGSHCCISFLEAGHDVVVVDNLSNGNRESLIRAADITGRDIAFEKADICDQPALEKVLSSYGCEAVIHFAGLKVMGESLQRPLDYYGTNVGGSVSLFAAMAACGIKTLIFSSTAAVYGEPQFLPVTESHPLGSANPYGRSKLMVETILRDLSASDPDWKIALLRYFNPVGAHESGRIGENPKTVTNNLMPFVAGVAAGKQDRLTVFGDDYDTPDGTGVRDFIHVMDLVEGHLAAYRSLAAADSGESCFEVNLGTGSGYSVLEMIRAFERASNRTIPFDIAPRRAGDVASCFADTKIAEDVLGWKAKRGLDEMCRDTWNWVCKNPNGYD